MKLYSFLVKVDDSNSNLKDVGSSNESLNNTKESPAMIMITATKAMTKFLSRIHNQRPNTKTHRGLKKH